MRITRRQLVNIIKEEAHRLREASRTPSNDEIDEWWDYMSPGPVNAITKRLKLTTSDRERWDARDWEKVIDYFVRVEMGDDRGWERGRYV